MLVFLYITIKKTQLKLPFLSMVNDYIVISLCFFVCMQYLMYYNRCTVNDRWKKALLRGHQETKLYYCFYALSDFYYCYLLLLLYYHFVFTDYTALLHSAFFLLLFCFLLRVKSVKFLYLLLLLKKKKLTFPLNSKCIIFLNRE